MRVSIKSAATASLGLCLVSFGAFQVAAQTAPSNTAQPNSSKSTVQTTAAQPAATSTASLSTNVSPLSRFTLTYLNQTLFGKSSIVDGDPDASGINRFQVSYKLADTKSIMFREDISFKAATKTRDSQHNMTDPFFAYTDSKFATLPGDWIMTVQGRAYLPLGESSRFVTKTAGAAALWAIADKSVGKFDFEFLSMFQVYNQTQDFYTSVDNNGAIKATGTKDWASYPIFGEVAYNITDKLTILHDTALYAESTRGGGGAAYKRFHQWYNESMIAYTPIKQVKVMASVENDATLESNNAVKLYQDSDITYNVYLRLTL